MRRSALVGGNHAVRVAAAVAFWAVAVLFVADLALLSGWLADEVAAAPSPAPSERPDAVASDPADPVPVRVDLDGGGEITFPLPPTRSEQTIDVAGTPTQSVQEAATDESGATYSVGVIEYPDQVDLSDPAVNLLASASGAAGSAGGRVTEQNLVIFNGGPAIEFEITTSSVTVQARYVLDGRRLYATSVAYTTGELPVDAYQFLDSLQLPENG